MIFDLVDPFTSNWGFTCRKIHNGPSMIILKSSYLGIHCIFSTAKFEGLKVGFWLYYRRYGATQNFVLMSTIFI